MLTDLEKYVIRTYGCEMAAAIRQARKANNQSVDIAMEWEVMRYKKLGRNEYLSKTRMHYGHIAKEMSEEYASLQVQ